MKERYNKNYFVKEKEIYNHFKRLSKLGIFIF